MKFSRSIFYVAIAAIAATLIAPTASATLFPGFSLDSETQALTIEDSSEMAFSFIMNANRESSLGTSIPESPDATKFCDAFNTRGCNLDTDARLWVRSVLPICGSAIENCVEGLSFVKSDGTIVEAQFDRYFKGETFTAPTELGMPGGSRVSIWNASGVPNQGGTEQYAVNVQLKWNYVRGTVTVDAFSASVFAIKPHLDSRFKKSGIYYGPAFNNVYASVTETGEYDYDGSCVAVEVGMCGEKVEFAPNTRLRLKMKLSNKVTGWLHGRIAKPDITVTPIDNTFNQLSVGADVVDVPMMYSQYKLTEMSPTFRSLINDMRTGHGIFGKSLYWQYPPDTPFAFTAVTELASSVKNTATEVHSYWNVASINGATNQRCLSDTSKLIGFVTTNAMAYAGKAPDWNGETLEYKVAGLHYLPDGKTLATGTYDLAMRSEAARCLYGFTSAPISASISIVSPEGEQKVATTVLNEKNGWLYLAAYGFTFSSPTIKVKLTQEAPKVEPTPTPTPTQSPLSLTSIKCIKGKVVKSVKGVNPKCPKGYKVK